MKSKFQKVKGTYDILPPESVKWNQLISSLQSLSKSFGFEEIKTPIIENLDLFKQNVDLTKCLNFEIKHFWATK